MAAVRIDSGLLSRLALTAMVLVGTLLLPRQTVAQLPPEKKVVEVRVEGNETIPRRKVLARVHTRAGRTFDPETIEEDVRQLDRSKMFVNIQTYSEPSDRVENGVIVTFRVTERPTLHEVQYVGNEKIKTKVLEKEIDLKVGSALDPAAIEDSRARIEEFYHSKGYGRARVTLIEGNKPTDRRAIFLINEGFKQRVLWTSFVGNSIASDGRLRTQVKSKPGIMWVFKGEVDREQIDEDLNRLTAYYRGLGFFGAEVGRELDFNASRKWLHLTFVINEGPRYKVRKISFIGNTKFATEELAASLSLKQGMDYNKSQLNKDQTTVEEKYGSVGYVFADVDPQVRLFEHPGELDLIYDISEGDRYRVGKINVRIKGEYPHTRNTAVLNRLSIKPGDIVDIRELRASERRLRASQLFLSDPTRGIQPKITFTPPDYDDIETEMAQPPRSHVHGQSPDGRRFDRAINLDVEGQWLDPAQPQPRANPPVAGQLLTPPPPQPRVNPPQLWANPPRGPVQETVIRGQYTPGSARQVPSFPPSRTWPNTRQPQTAVAPQPPAYQPPAYQQPAYQPPAYQPPANQQPVYQAQPAAPAYGDQFPVNGPMMAVPGQLPTGGSLFEESSPFDGLSPDQEPTRLLPIDVIAHETQTGRLMFGVGVNSDAGLIGSIVIDEQNFDWTRFPNSWEDIRNATAWRGAGQRFRVEMLPGTRVQRYMVNFQEPYLMDTSVALGLSGFFYDRRYREWDEQRLGGRVRFGYRFTHDLSGGMTIRGAQINIHDPVTPTPDELTEVIGDSSLWGFRGNLTHDTRDNAFLATEGHLLEMSFEQVVGSFSYPRVEVDLQRYFLMRERPDGSGRHVLSLSGRVAWTGADTPIYDHYFIGGFSTIRGYDFRGASPIDDPTGVRVGGHFMALAKIQYLFPITADDMLRAVVFCDTGTVEPEIDNWSDKYRIAPGFGLRIMIPAMGPAPIALDFAFPISSEDGDRIEVFSFFVGFNR